MKLKEFRRPQSGWQSLTITCTNRDNRDNGITICDNRTIFCNIGILAVMEPPSVTINVNVRLLDSEGTYFGWVWHDCQY